MRAEQHKPAGRVPAHEPLDRELLPADQGRVDHRREHEGEAVEQDLPAERRGDPGVQPEWQVLGEALLPGEEQEGGGGRPVPVLQRPASVPAVHEPEPLVADALHEGADPAAEVLS